MVRLAEGLVSFAIKNKIEERGQFVKNTFKPHLDLSSLQGEKAITFVSTTQPKKVNKDLYFQIDDYIKSKEKKASKATIR